MSCVKKREKRSESRLMKVRLRKSKPQAYVQALEWLLVCGLTRAASPLAAHAVGP